MELVELDSRYQVHQLSLWSQSLNLVFALIDWIHSFGWQIFQFEGVDTHLLLPPNKLQAGPDRPTGDVDQLLRGHQASEHIPGDKILCLNNMQLQLVSIVFARIMNVHNWFSQKIASRLINFSRAQNHRSWRVCCARVQPRLRKIATCLFVCLWNKSTNQLSLLHRSTALP